jgi:hypothetical protein
MNDLVWFGNYVIPRWEAFLLLGAGIVLVAVAAVGIAFGVGYLVSKLI